MGQSNSTTEDDFSFDFYLPSSMEGSRESETDSNIPAIVAGASRNERNVPDPGNDEQQGERTQTEQFTSDNAAFSPDGDEDTKETSPEHERGLNMEVARLTASEAETPSGTGQDLSRGRVQAADSDPEVDRRSNRVSVLDQVRQIEEKMSSIQTDQPTSLHFSSSLNIDLASGSRPPSFQPVSGSESESWNKQGKEDSRDAEQKTGAKKAPNQEDEPEKKKEEEQAVPQQTAPESPASEQSFVIIDSPQIQLPSPDHQTPSPVQQVEYQSVQLTSRPVPADRPVNRSQRVEYGSEQLVYTHGPPERYVNRSPWNTDQISRESPAAHLPEDSQPSTVGPESSTPPQPSSLSYARRSLSREALNTPSSSRVFQPIPQRPLSAAFPVEEQQYHSYQYPPPFQYQQPPPQQPQQQQHHQQPTSMTPRRPWLPEQQSYEDSMQKEGAKSPPQAWQRTPGSQFTGHQYYHHPYYFQQRPPPAQPAHRPVFLQEHHSLPRQGNPPTEGFRHQQGDVYRAPHPTRATPTAHASGQRMPPAYAQQCPPVGGIPPKNQVAAASMMSGTSATPPPAGGRAGRIPATSTQRETGNVSGGMQQQSQARNRPPAAPSPTQCQPEEDSCRTVRVSGGQVAVNKQMMMLYFKNSRRSGGGPISRVEVNHQEVTALVTFEQKADADRVVKRSHSVDNTDLNVVLCQSEGSNTSIPHQPEGGCTKVKVRGLLAETTETLLSLYFEDLADDCVQVTMGPRQGEAVVEFQDPEVARAILAQSHTIQDQVVTVTPDTTPTTTMPTSPTTTTTTTTRQTTPTTATAAGGGGGRGGSRPSAGPSPAPRVRRRGLAEPVTTSRQYAERQRQSAGRPVREPRDREGSGEEEEKARNSSQQQGASEGESAPAEGATVSVRGLPAEQSKDVLMLYFENFRRSGGGDVREVYLYEQTGVFFITFYKAEDAKRVTARSHTIDNQKLDVRLEDPPKPYSDRILLKNLPPLQTTDELLNFVEVKTKLVVDSIRFGEDGATAVIVFTTCITFGEVEAAICNKQWKGQELKVSPLHQSCTVLVQNLPQHPPVTEDLLTNFFENTQRHGGGEVSAVQIDEERQYALVTFVDPVVAARVSGRQDYELQNCPLTVSLYMDCLGVSGGRSEPAATIPPPHPLTDSQCQKLTHLQGVPALMQGLQESLTASNARLELGRGRGSIVCTLTQEVKNVHQLAKTWAQDVDHILQSHLQPVIVQQVELTAEEFAQAERECLQTMGREEKMNLAYDEGKQLLTIVCREEKQPVVDELLTIVQTAQREVERKKQEQTDKMTVTKGKQQLLKEHQDIQDAREKYPRLEIVFNEEDDRIELKGLQEEIDCVKMLFLKVNNDMTTLQHTWNSDLHKQLMSLPIARSTVESLCKACCPDAVIEFTDDGFLTHSFDAETAEMAQTTAVQAVQRRAIRFDDDHRHAIKLQEWVVLKCSIVENNDELVVMEETEETLIMVGIGPSVQRDYRCLVEFLEKNGISQQVLQVPSVLHGLFEPYLKGKVNELNLKQDNFVFDPDNDQVIITGNKACVEAAQSILNAFLQEITLKQVTYTQPSMAAFLQTREWTRKQKDILHNARCVVLDPRMLPEMYREKMSGGRDGDAASAQMLSDLGSMASDDQDMQQFLHTLAYRESRRHVNVPRQPAPVTEQATPPVPTRPRIFLNPMSDITKEEHKALVNSSNPALRLGDGQVSKALLEVGGPEIQEECRAKYPGGIKMGDVAISTGGKLMCQKIFHCTLPQETDEEKIRKVVSSAVKKCLKEADTLELSSIGFPALGTGVLKYPAALVAKTLYRATMEYGREHPDTVISDVFFILHKKDKELTRVFAKEDEKYKERMRQSQAQASARAESVFSSSSEPTTGIERHLFFEETRGRVYKILLGLGGEAVERADKELLACYKENVDTICVNDLHLHQWDDLNRFTLVGACRPVHVDITMNFDLGRLTLQGFIHNLEKVQVHKIAREAETAVAEQQEAKVLVKEVQWSTIEMQTTGFVIMPYSVMNNYKIEMAYRKGINTTSIHEIVDGKRLSYFIDFLKMEERFEDTDPAAEERDPVTIIRQMMIKGSEVPLPDKWSNMQSKLVDLVPLQPSSPEYRGIADVFRDSLNMPTATIVKIERIQNVTLYKQYQALKQQMESTMPEGKLCEWPKLWHGTTSEAIDGIVRYGFNRSFSIVDRSAYGQGAYFASKAEYAARNEYAKLDDFDQRNIFLCRVLVGLYMKGDKDMRMPPEPTDGGPRFHSTVDDVEQPTIFVTYNDVQAYPDYRIVFKDS